MVRLLFTALGLLIGLLVLSTFAPLANEDLSDATSEFRDQCEVLFVGPSYVNSQVLPDVIDRESARVGAPLKSCKYALTSLKGFELRVVLDNLLSDRWARLKLVVIDITLGPDTRFADRNAYTSRVLRWHTWEFVPWYLNHTQGQKLVGTGRERQIQVAARLWTHLKHVAVNLLLVGRGSEHVASLSEPPEEQPWVYKPPSGKKALRKQARENDKRVQRLLQRRARKETRIPAKAMGQWMLELRDVARSHGVEADGLIAPVWSPAFVSTDQAQEGDMPVVHAFDDPRKYPALYRSDSHTKSEHLSPKGSNAYSQLLGGVLAERMRSLR